MPAGKDDRRRLGVSVTRIVWHDCESRTELPVDHPALREGWWSVERDGARQHRWTDGDALLPPMPGATAVEIRLAGAANYPADA